ncbi:MULTISPECIES: N-acetylmuramoyl-L-alanine amidase [unclassified Azospirillum]|uniref:N-acetylmuramoyl-L-alanine amidase n=1 Tax=unclassified Azospirillum TaxID=2630922 RepID=UPI000B6DD2F7|nr:MULTISPECIES: N-acetylmuramoyl-L-alanine amidase [unclassified Azospirillum]SNS38854.1 N-acetylmuramoyl-L-alanine amidase [Azospirillum sp. RU38E]SNS57243.1 N-acetylmuramoyl-L-alanine amidase [Azospirillum sp. RU37A]
MTRRQHPAGTGADHARQQGRFAWPVFCALLLALLWLLPWQAARAGEDGRIALNQAQVAAIRPPASPALSQILDARLGVHPDKTRFVLELTQPVPFRVQTQSSPHSVVIDLADVAWGGAMLPGRGLVLAVASDNVAPGRVRLVLPTTGPVRVALAEIIPPRDGRPPRFILDLVPASGPPHASAPQTIGTLPPLPAPSGAQEPIGTPPEMAASVTGPQPSANGPQSAGTPGAGLVVAAASLGSAPLPPRPKPPAKVELPLIVIDPGHGGQDPGAIAGNGTYEKDITLAMARELRRQLLASKRYRVVLTRDKDIFIPLRDRAAVARDQGASLFISLHADSIDRKQVRGLSIYTLSEKASDREAETLAQRENRADALGGLDLSSQPEQVANILINLSQREKMNQSRRFAALVLTSLDKAIAVLPSPLRSAGFGVLTAPDVPSVLVEMGYLSHTQDAKLLTTSTHRRRMAASLVRAVDGYFSPGAGRKRS